MKWFSELGNIRRRDRWNVPERKSEIRTGSIRSPPFGNRVFHNPESSLFDCSLGSNKSPFWSIINLWLKNPSTNLILDQKNFPNLFRSNLILKMSYKPWNHTHWHFTFSCRKSLQNFLKFQWKKEGDFRFTYKAS